MIMMVDVRKLGAPYIYHGKALLWLTWLGLRFVNYVDGTRVNYGLGSSTIIRRMHVIMLPCLT